MNLTFIHLLLAIFSVHFAVASDETWQFSNWNKYKNSKKSGDTESWFKAWGIAKSDGWAWPGDDSSGSNHKIVKDPSGSKDQVLQVTYPSGSSNPASDPQGGIGFYAQPIKLSHEAKTVTFQYQVYFPKKFQFVKGNIYMKQ